LANPTTLKLQSIRVSHLCLRSAYQHQGNALSALGRNDEARKTYEKILPLMEKESRCGRLDWERSSVYVNIGNTYSRQGEFDLANEQYNLAEQLGRDHLEVENGNKADGMGIMLVAMRNRAFALKKAGKEEEAKAEMRKVLELQQQHTEEKKKQKARDKEALEKQQAEEAAALAAAEAADGGGGDTNPAGQQVAVS
jgi:tetratricopeptide (TPR) repeat protein